MFLFEGGDLLFDEIWNETQRERERKNVKFRNGRIFFLRINNMKTLKGINTKLWYLGWEDDIKTKISIILGLDKQKKKLKLRFKMTS